jgi:hypothetical protein
LGTHQQRLLLEKRSLEIIAIEKVVVKTTFSFFSMVCTSLFTFL